MSKIRVPNQHIITKLSDSILQGDLVYCKNGIVCYEMNDNHRIFYNINSLIDYMGLANE